MTKGEAPPLLPKRNKPEPASADHEAPPSSPAEKETLGVRLPVDLIIEVKTAAVRMRKTVSDVGEAAFREWLARRKG